MPLSFWIVLLAVLVYGGVHSTLSSLRARAVARRWFGRHTDRWFRLLYNLVAGLMLLPVLLLPVALTDRELYRIPLPWSLLTVLLQALALLALFCGLRQTGISAFLGLRQLVRGAEGPPRLVVNGFYRYVRHPLYTAGLVLIWLMPVMTCNLLALNIGFTAYIVIGALLEERKLLSEFGQVYADYRRRTPMLIPGLRRPRR